MSLRPKLMNSTDLMASVTAASFLLGLDERCGVIDLTVRKWLEKLLDEAAQEQIARRMAGLGQPPAETHGVAITRDGTEIEVTSGPTFLPLGA